MKNLLVPTDFSDTANNAAIYALKLAGQTGAEKVILYHAYQYPMIIDPMVPVVPMIDEAQLRKDSIEGLENWKKQLLPHCPPDCILETHTAFGILGNGLDEVCRETESGMIVMGITGGGFLEEKLIGSNTLSVAKHSITPVIIVPPDARFTPIEKVMLLSDFDKADKTIPVSPIRKLLSDTGAKLLVFNQVETPDEYGVMYPSNVMGEGFAIHTLLQDLHPEFHYSHDKDFMESVNDIALQERVDLMITVPKKHSFLESLFATDHTRKLAFHLHLPLMVVHT